MNLINADNELLCKNCSGNFTHIEKVNLRKGNDSYYTQESITIRQEENSFILTTSTEKEESQFRLGAEPLVEIYYSCEFCSYISKIELAQHKGNINLT